MGVAVAVGVAVALGVADEVGDKVGVALGVTETAGVGVADGASVEVGAGVGVTGIVMTWEALEPLHPHEQAMAKKVANNSKLRLFMLSPTQQSFACAMIASFCHET